MFDRLRTKTLLDCVVCHQGARRCVSANHLRLRDGTIVRRGEAVCAGCGWKAQLCDEQGKASAPPPKPPRPPRTKPAAAPVPDPPFTGKLKVCRRCDASKEFEAFGSWNGKRDDVCLRCRTAEREAAEPHAIDPAAEAWAREAFRALRHHREQAGLRTE